MDVWEYLTPYMRPPDVPNTEGIGRADLADPLPVDPTPVKKFGAAIVRGRLRPADTPAGVTTWPPIQELNYHIPNAGAVLGPFLNLDGTPILGPDGNPIRKTAVHVQLSPMCFPMHDHSEPSQTAQGGNYNQGMIAGMNFIGDRNADGRLNTTTGGGLTVDPATDAITFPDAPLTFDDPAFDAAFNERAVYGADPETSPQPPAGPLPPYMEEVE